jgi:predicted MFS family arabinose efflux permease
MFGTFAYVGADLNQRLGLSFSAVGGVLAAFGVGGLLYVASVKILLGRLGERWMILGGSILLCMSYSALALGTHWSAAFAAIAAAAFGFYMLHNTLQVHATQMSPRARSTAVGVFSSALYLGQSAGVAAAAPFFDRLGALPIYLTAAFVFPLLALWLSSLLKKPNA